MLLHRRGTREDPFKKASSHSNLIQCKLSMCVLAVAKSALQSAAHAHGALDYRMYNLGLVFLLHSRMAVKQRAGIKLQSASPSLYKTYSLHSLYKTNSLQSVRHSVSLQGPRLCVMQLPVWMLHTWCCN